MPEISQTKVKKKTQERIKWSEFRSKWKDCEACVLCETRSRICLAKGSVPCDVLFVGEAPGQSEDVIGQPFVGPAGKLLDEMINEAFKTIAGKDYDDEVYNNPLRRAFTNIVCCLPIDETGKKAIEPLAEHAKACSPRLIEFIDKVAQPKAIIFVGKYATKYLKKFYPKIQSWTSAEITHPAAILRADVGQQGLLVQRATITIRDVFETILENL